MLLALLVVALQQPTAPPPPPKPTMQAPIAKAVVQPAEAAVTVGDTLRLAVSAFDSAGRPYTDYSSNWFTSGGFFEGGVDSTGLVTGGSTGTLNVTALVRPKSGGKPVTAIARITILPPPAARVDLPSRHPQRRRTERLQPRTPARRPTREPAARRRTRDGPALGMSDAAHSAGPRSR